jgi:hypothetical protein
MAKQDFESTASLALSREEMRTFGYRVIDVLVDHFDKISERPIGAKRPESQSR